MESSANQPPAGIGLELGLGLRLGLGLGLGLSCAIGCNEFSARSGTIKQLAKLTNQPIKFSVWPVCWLFNIYA